MNAHRAWRDEEGNRFGDPLRLYSVAQLHAVDTQIWAESRDRLVASRAQGSRLSWQPLHRAAEHPRLQPYPQAPFRVWLRLQ